MSINPSIIVTTYNKPRELELVLCGLNMQKYLPAEILIADDGSTHVTADLIKKWASKSKTPIKHIWHEDIGFRKLRICNKAVKEAQGNYLIFLDGDSIPHPKWLKDHVTSAREGTVLCGRRVRLGPKISDEIDLQYVQSGKLRTITKPLLMSALRGDTKRVMLGIRLPSGLARCFHPRERRLMGVNFSLHKELFERVGSLIEVGEKRCREDAELEIQLISAGATRFPLINRAIVYHLYHPERPPDKELNDQIEARHAYALEQRNLGTK